jgi:hypothetical protein
MSRKNALFFLDSCKRLLERTWLIEKRYVYSTPIINLVTRFQIGILHSFDFFQEHDYYLRINGRPIFSTESDRYDDLWKEWKKGCNFDPYWSPIWPNEQIKNITGTFLDDVFTFNELYIDILRVDF